ncbi:MAG: LAGLIDADG family homing endonuclease [bacterium]|nr:LAGLIDADG family homing endonuclease [bacterium]
MGRTKPIVANEYVVGLTDGEGCFHVNLVKLSTYTSGVRVQMHFHVKMQEKDRPLLEKLRNTLKCGEVYFQKEKRANHCQCYRYTVHSQKDILAKIIPFFLKYPLQSVSKRESFKAFCRIGQLVAKQAHLTKRGIKRIQLLKAKMNRKTIGLA